jgi:hypothetical protein
VSSYTTGEWTLNKQNGRIVECDGNKILTAASTPWDAKEAWANAKLAKAALDLLEFAQQVVKFAADHSNFYLMAWAQNVVNKVEGKP